MQAFSYKKWYMGAPESTNGPGKDCFPAKWILSLAGHGKTDW